MKILTHYLTKLDKKRVASLTIVLVLLVALLLGISASASYDDVNDDVRLDDDIVYYCFLIGNRYNISPYLLVAMIEEESDGDRYCRTGNCKGLMQVNDTIHKDRMEKLGVSDIYDAYSNILVGTDYLSELATECGEVSYALDRYNGNSKAKSNTKNGVLSTYSRRVLEREAVLSARVEGE